MNKNHYKYFYLDFNIYKKYLDTGIIPEGLRKDRFIKKFEDVKIEHQNVLSWNNRTCLYQEDIPVFINKIYKDPVLGNKGYGALYYTITKSYFGISRDRVKDELNKLESYQLHKPIIHQKVKRSILVKQPLNQFQIDLTSITDTYNGYKYIVVIIDLFTKFIYTKALKNKDAKTVLDFVKKVFLIEKPKILQSDNGGEFKNDIMNKYLLSINVKQVYSKSYTPTTQGAVERCNRTIKGMIFRYLTSNNTKNWVFILPQITENYNNSKHSSIGMSPLDLKNSSKSLIRAVHKDNILTSKKNIIKHHRSFTPLALYDLCRLDIKSNNKDTTFTKYYSANWSKEIFMIESISRPRDSFSNSTYFINNRYLPRNKLQKIDILNKQVEVYWESPYKGWWIGIVGAKKGVQIGVYYEKYKPDELIWCNFENQKIRFID